MQQIQRTLRAAGSSPTTAWESARQGGHASLSIASHSAPSFCRSIGLQAEVEAFISKTVHLHCNYSSSGNLKKIRSPYRTAQPSFIFFPFQLVTPHAGWPRRAIYRKGGGWHEDEDSGAAVLPIYYAKWLDPAKLSSWDQLGETIATLTALDRRKGRVFIGNSYCGGYCSGCSSVTRRCPIKPVHPRNLSCSSPSQHS